MTDLPGFFQSLAEQGCPALFRLGPYRAFLVTRPEHVRHVYQREQAGVYINNRFASVTKRVFGDSLVNNDGPAWASQRRMLKPHFTNAAVKQWADLIDRKLVDLADAWDRKAGERLAVEVECAVLTQAIMTMVSGKPRRSGRGRIARTAEPSYNGVAADNQGSLRQGMPEVTPVEIRAAVAHSAQEPAEATHFGSVEVSAVGIPSLQAGEDVKSVLFGEEAGQTEAAQEVIEAIHVVHQEFLVQTLGRALMGPIFSWLPVPSSWRFQRAIQTVDRVVDPLIAQASRTRQGLIALLRETVDPDTGCSMDAKLLRDEIVALYIAGQETTAIALTWLLYELAKHPDIAERARKDVLNWGEDEINAEALPYLWDIVQESLRLHPPAIALLRYAVSDDRIGDVAIPRGSLVLMSPYITQRLPDIWPDPERFDPARFGPGARAPGVCSFVPFGSGRHMCLGLHLANRILLQSIVTLLRRFEFYVPCDYRVNPRSGLLLRPQGGCRIQIVPRLQSDRPAVAAGR